MSVQGHPTPPNPPSWHLPETYKGLITLSVEALKMLMLINGGAAIAVLTYLGNLVARAPAGHAPKMIRSALLWYCSGLLATVVAMIFAYVTQLLLYNEELRRQSGQQTRQWHAAGIWLSILLALYAASAFSLGTVSASRALTRSWSLVRSSSLSE